MKLNLNKLFPRLPIRVKLLVAFALLVTLPLLATSAFGTRETLRQIETSVQGTLQHELEIARGRTEDFLLDAEEDLEYMVDRLLPTRGESARDPTFPYEEVQEFLGRKPKFVQARLLDREGDPILVVHPRLTREEALESVGGGAFYAHRARQLEPGQNDILAVEIRDHFNASGAIPAFAILRPVHGSDGELQAVAVGEVYAAALFRAIESGGSGLGGTIGLVNADGHYLYHSERKRDWNTLLATRPEVNLSAVLGEGTAAEILSGNSGMREVGAERLVSFQPLLLAGPSGSPLFIYRAVPISVIKGPAHQFLLFVGVGGFVVLAIALGFAVVASTQFTRPIYRLREEARRLARGEVGSNPVIETNDELEDLAGEFATMALHLRRHRQHLEELVEERTGALREAHAELEEVLANSEDAIIRLDREGRVRVWNRGAEKMFQYRRQDTLDQRLDELLGFGESRKGSWSWVASESEKEPHFARRTVLKRKDGTSLHVGLIKRAIRDEAGTVLGYTVIIRDETRSRALERQMLRSERLAAAGRLAAGVAHEINNPIGIIVSRIDLLDEEISERYEDSSVRSDLSVLREQADRVGGVARRLLTLAREDPGTREPTDLNELAAKVLNFTGPELKKRELRLQTALSDDLPAIVVDPRGLETVLLNLVLNAIDATEAGGEIRVITRARADRGGVVLEVHDTGGGISEETLEQIFEPFFTTKKRPLGTGLGLSVSQTVVEAHGGTIEVVSEPGVGSRFIVRLPTRLDEET